MPQYTVELARNPDPLTVMVKPAPPASAIAGVMLPSNGRGLSGTFTVRVTLAVAAA